MKIIHDWILNDIRLLKQCDGVQCIQYNIVGELVFVTFTLEFALYAQASEERVQSPENIKLVYKNTSQLNQPAVLAVRDGFPRDLPHLNPTALDQPPSICLWRKGGTETLYKQRGIIEVIRILQQWLEDASLEQLEKDGWEPSPRASFLSFHCDVPKLQQMVVNSNNSNSIFVANSFGLFFEANGKFIYGYSSGNKVLNKKTFDINKKVKKEEQLTQPFNLPSDKIVKLKMVVAIPPIDLIDSKHNASKIDSIEDLRCYGNYNSLNTVLDIINKELSDSKDDRGTIVVVAHRRPFSLIPEIQGLSENPIEREIEIVPFLIRRNKGNVSVHFLSLRSNVNAKVFSDISNYAVTQGQIGIIGCGALGSTIADQLARAGHTEITLWDMDCLEAHNSARHVCTHSVYEVPNVITKADLMGKHIENLSEDHKINVSSKNQNFELEQNRTFCRNAVHLIDTTASDLDRYWHNTPGCPVSRLYISDQGRIGLIQTQPKNGIPDMLDLDAKLYLSANQNAEIHNWLSRQSGLSTTLVGLSCSSDTLKMPWSTVINHASSLLPSLKRQFAKDVPLLGVNVVDEDGVPMGYKQLGDSSSLSFISKSVIDNNNTQWRVTISTEVLQKIQSIKTKHSPREAGGYLLGLYNIESHRISVVFASEGKFNSTTSRLDLEPIENDPEVPSVLKDSCEMLVPLGTWHSHPNSKSKESYTDMTTYNNAISNPEQLLPFVMLIQGNDEPNILVGYNRNI
ncbi:ThiF family adenylyltransferase [Vibrio parahaemolyticus]|uniref:ThiF family adenylyltransferase n=1 Tax=Vibrio antiquarius (strain Ex25) TaxID=150340 RepID=UPI0009418CC9|nr:ThiF family adenylyltransferase [Vibrio antiquarius]EJE4192356.1 ThiF family adenylyltransferase [Vibrio parahaemolyticus]OKQ14078.1 hypothetical protein H058_07330 [Vibrio antiquarius]